MNRPLALTVQSIVSLLEHKHPALLDLQILQPVQVSSWIVILAREDLVMFKGTTSICNWPKDDKQHLRNCWLRKCSWFFGGWSWLFNTTLVMCWGFVAGLAQVCTVKKRSHEPEWKSITWTCLPALIYVLFLTTLGDMRDCICWLYSAQNPCELQSCTFV